MPSLKFKLTVFTQTHPNRWLNAYTNSLGFVKALRLAGFDPETCVIKTWHSVESLESIKPEPHETILVLRENVNPLFNFNELRFARLCYNNKLIPISFENFQVQFFELALTDAQYQLFKTPHNLWQYLRVPMFIECFKGDILWDAHGSKIKVARSEVAASLQKIQPTLLLPMLGTLLSKQAQVDQCFEQEVKLCWMYLLHIYAETHTLTKVHPLPETYQSFDEWCVWAQTYDITTATV